MELVQLLASLNIFSFLFKKCVCFKSFCFYFFLFLLVEVTATRDASKIRDFYSFNTFLALLVFGKSCRIVWRAVGGRKKIIGSSSCFDLKAVSRVCVFYYYVKRLNVNHFTFIVSFLRCSYLILSLFFFNFQLINWRSWLLRIFFCLLNV